MHAASFCYNLDCCMVRCNGKIQVCWHGAIVKTITTILVWCKCNRQHRWFYIAVTHMNAGLVQVSQTCMLVGAGFTDMTAGYVQLKNTCQMQLLQTWLMVACKCNIHGC